MSAKVGAGETAAASVWADAQPLRLLLLGATGAVGGEVLRQALANARIAQVTAPTRRALSAASKLFNPLTDFAALRADVDWWTVDAAICCLGTTIEAAGSRPAFAAVDRDLPIEIAAYARAAGCRSFALNSSLGASLAGNFYLRTKAEAENGIRELGFPSLTVVRPSLIDAAREHSRPAERVGILIGRLLQPVIPKRYRPVAAAAIAQALLQATLEGHAGERIIESERLGSS